MNKNYNKILIVMGSLMLISSIFLTIEKVSYGPELNGLKSSEAKLYEERLILENEIQKKSSTREINDRSQELGFVKPSVVIYLSDLENLASLR